MRKAGNMTTFNELSISKQIKQAVEEIGYCEATEIQKKAIPLIMGGKDVLGKSQTGTGKTAAFGIPAIEHVTVKRKHPQVLILCPTRELVIQVATELRRFCKYKEGVKITPIYGGEPINRQIQLLSRGCGIVVGTPGRVMDHMRRHTLKLTECDMVVLDEADEMLNMGFKEDIEEILTAFPHEHQTILFSATMPKAIMQITKQFQNNPVTVEIVAKQKTIHTVDQVYYEAPRGKKSDALFVLLEHFSPNLSIIFCNTKKQVDELCTELSAKNINVLGLHGDMKQEHRTRVMKQYRSGNYPVLIATDVAARGIDVDNVEMVFNYDVPQDNEYYIHRVGRTGRAGKSGLAITLITGRKQEHALQQIMRFTKTNIRKCSLPTAAQMLKVKKDAFIEEVKQACSKGITAESMEIANCLMADGIAIENLISALISMNFQPNIIQLETKENKRHLQEYETVVLRFDAGKKDRIHAGNLLCAIVEYCECSSDIIGRIDVRSTYSLVSVASEYAEMIMNQVHSCMIGGKEVHARFYDKKPIKKTSSKSSKEKKKVKDEKEEKKSEKRTENRRGSRRKERSRKRKKK